MDMKRVSYASEGPVSYSSLAQTLAELKHTVSSNPQPKNLLRRAQSHTDLGSEGRDKVTLMVVDRRGRKMRMQLPISSMARLQDFLEEKMKIMKSLQRIYYRDQELLPCDARPFAMHGMVEGEELVVREEAVSLTLRLPRERHTVFKDALLTDTVGRLKTRIEEQTGIAYAQQRLRYLEDYDLGDEMRLYDCGVVPGATLHVHFWSDWSGIYDSVRDCDSDTLLRLLGVDPLFFLRSHSTAPATAPGTSTRLAAPLASSSLRSSHVTPGGGGGGVPAALLSPTQTISHPANPTTPSATATASATQTLSPRKNMSHGLEVRSPLPSGLGEGAWAALYLAAFDGSVRLCRILVGLGLDPGRSTFWRHSARGTGRTPIHAAAGRGHLACLQELVNPRVAFCVPDSSGMTAEMWAKQNGHAACADLLAMARWDQRLARTRAAEQVKLPPVKKS